MPPVRIGLVGLSTSSKSTSWAALAHLPFLQSDIGKKHFEIVALCNSSKASGEKSKEHYKLSDSVKTYDSPEKLAQDPDVDLVVNVTGVGQHYAVLLPVAKAGKNVYTELPLAQDYAANEGTSRRCKREEDQDRFWYARPDLIRVDSTPEDHRGWHDW